MTEPTRLTPEVEQRLTVWMTQYMEQHRPSGGDWYLQLAKEAIHALALPEAGCPWRTTLKAAWSRTTSFSRTDEIASQHRGRNVGATQYSNQFVA
jgi:hypothetical protein